MESPLSVDCLCQEQHERIIQVTTWTGDSITVLPGFTVILRVSFQTNKGRVLECGAFSSEDVVDVERTPSGIGSLLYMNGTYGGLVDSLTFFFEGSGMN